MTVLPNSMKYYTVERYKFSDISHLIAYILNNNPARLKPFNWLDQDCRSKPDPTPIYLTTPDDLIEDATTAEGLWCLAVATIEKTLAKYPKRERAAYYATKLKYWDQRKSREQVAEEERVTERAVQKWCSKIRKDLESKFRGMGLLPPPIDE